MEESATIVGPYVTLSNPLGTGFILILIGFFRYREEKDLFLY